MYFSILALCPDQFHSITHAELILSPAYDIGNTAEELRRVNLDRLAGLA